MADSTIFQSLSAVFQQARVREEISETHFRIVYERLEHSIRHAVSEYDAHETISEVRNSLQQMWLENRAQPVTEALKILTNASRDPLWRSPFGVAGIIEVVLEIIGSDRVDPTLMTTSLRFIGNTCADSDDNRYRVTRHNGLKKIIEEIGSTTYTEVGILALYNLSRDYRPAQKTLKSYGLLGALIRTLRTPSKPLNPIIYYICRLLDDCSEDLEETASPDDAAEVLFRIAGEDLIDDVDDFVSLADAAISHFKHDQFQHFLVNRHMLDLPLISLVRSYFFHFSSLDGLSIPLLPATVHNGEDEAHLLSTRRALVAILADVSALPQFGDAYPLISSTVISLLLWLDAKQVQLQVCACIILGNIACSDAVCCELVYRNQTHVRLLKLLERTSDPQILDAALGFLRNLSRPLQNKPVLGQAGTFQALSRVWNMSVVPQVQYTSVTITRLLVSDSVTNIEALLRGSPSYSSVPAEEDYLAQLLLLFRKTDDLPTKLEIGRVITAIYRSLNALGQTARVEITDSLICRLTKLYPDIGQPLAAMVVQSKWPIIRSEGFFALALVARSNGGRAIVRSLMQQSEVTSALSDMLITGAFTLGPESHAGLDKESKARDKSNILILMDELTKVEVKRSLRYIYFALKHVPQSRKYNLIL